MKRALGTARIAVAGMILMSGALGMFEDVKLAATNQTFPRIPRTEQEQKARSPKDVAASAMTQGFSLIARARSGESDPCVPIVPVTFSARGPVIC